MRAWCSLFLTKIYKYKTQCHNIGCCLVLYSLTLFGHNFIMIFLDLWFLNSHSQSHDFQFFIYYLKNTQIFNLIFMTIIIFGILCLCTAEKIACRSWFCHGAEQLRHEQHDTCVCCMPLLTRPVLWPVLSKTRTQRNTIEKSLWSWHGMITKCQSWFKTDC